MKRLLTTLCAAVLLVPAPAAAQVQVPIGDCRLRPAGQLFAFVQVNDVCVNLTSLIAPVGGAAGLFRLVLPRLEVGGAGLLTGLDVTFKQDPYIDFGVTTTNLLASTTSYAFYFGTPIDPGLYNRATSTGRVTVASVVGGDAAVDQDAGADYVTVYGSQGATLIPLGVDLGSTRCEASGGPATCNHPPPAGGPAENTFSPIFLDNLEVELVYSQEGTASEAEWNARAEVFPAVVPEPGTAALTLAGAAVLAVGAVRRRRPTRA